MKNALDKYLEESDSILAFIRNVGVKENVDRKIIYEEYREYCEEIGVKPQKLAALTRKLNSMGWKVKDTYQLRRRVFVYVKE